MEIPPYLVNEQFDDRYFDVVDALEEAKHIFFRGCGISEFLLSQPPGQRSVRIGETGFGAGRLLLSLMDFLDGTGLGDLEIIYNSVELHPVTAGRMAGILSGFRKETGQLVDLLVNAYAGIDIAEPGWHRLTFERPFGTVTLNLWIGEAMEMVQALEAPCDAWFLDGHGPKKNPSIWRPELLHAIGEKTAPGGTCATFTVAVAVQRALEAAGFSVEQRPGMGRKKAVLRGVKG